MDSIIPGDQPDSEAVSIDLNSIKPPGQGNITNTPPAKLKRIKILEMTICFRQIDITLVQHYINFLRRMDPHLVIEGDALRHITVPTYIPTQAEFDAETERQIRLKHERAGDQPPTPPTHPEPIPDPILDYNHNDQTVPELNGISQRLVI